MLLRDVHPLCAQILDGKLDDHLDHLRQAINARAKMQFRVGQTVVLQGTRNPQFEGLRGTVEKVNQKTIRVRLDYDGEVLNVPLRMAVQPDAAAHPG